MKTKIFMPFQKIFALPFILLFSPLFLAGQFLEEQLLPTSLDANGINFGTSVDIIGEYQVIGSSLLNRIEIFKCAGQTFNLEALLSSSSESAFGTSVGITTDYVIAGAPNDDLIEFHEGSAYIFHRNENEEWVKFQKLTADIPYYNMAFGHSVAIHGDVAIVGAPQDNATLVFSGSVFVFERDIDGVWQQAQKIVPDDILGFKNFGETVDFDGNRILIGAPYDDVEGFNSGSAYTFIKDQSGMWVQEQKLFPADAAGFDMFASSVSIHQNHVVIGAVDDDDNGESSGSAYLFEYENGSWSEIQKLTAFDGAKNDRFGSGISVFGDRVIVGADAANNFDDKIGKAYLFQKGENGVWDLFSPLGNNFPEENNAFGSAVCLLDSRAIIGAPYQGGNGPKSGSAFIFESDGKWFQTAELVPSPGAANDRYSRSLSINGDFVAIGAPDDYEVIEKIGSVYNYKCQNGMCTLIEKIVPSDGVFESNFGNSVVMNNIQAFVGAPGDDDKGEQSGSVYIYDMNSDGTWTLNSKLKALDGTDYSLFGFQLALDGDFLLVGAPWDRGNDYFSGSVYVYEKNSSGEWIYKKKLFPSDDSGDSFFGGVIALDGDYTIIGAPNEFSSIGYSNGSSYVFKRNNSGTWVQDTKLLPQDGVYFNQFGTSVAIQDNIIAVGATNADPYDDNFQTGSVYIYEMNGSESWVQQQKIRPDDGRNLSLFGSAISLDDDHLIVGAPGDDINGINTGVYYVFEPNPNGLWQKESLISPPGLGANNKFGSDVLKSGERLLVGSDFIGQDGSKGAAFIYNFNVSPPSVSCAGGLLDEVLFVDENCNVVLIDYTDMASATDPLDPSPTITQFPAPGSKISDGVSDLNLLLIATNMFGASDTCAITLNIRDNIPPSVICNDGIYFLEGEGCMRTVPDLSAEMGYSDNCDDSPTLEQTPAAGTIIAMCDQDIQVLMTVTDASGNLESCELTLSTGNPLNAEFTSLQNVSCPAGNDGSGSIVISGGCPPYSYSLGPDLSGLSAGTTSVMVTDDNNCSKVFEFEITEPDPLTIVSSPTIDSTTDVELIISGGTAPFSYQWNDAQNQITNPAIGLIAGSYVVTITDANGCISVHDVNVSTTTNVVESSLIQVHVYPNPVTDLLIIDQLAGPVDIHLINNLGHLIKKYQTNKEEFTLEMDALPNGIYFTKIYSEDSRERVFKVVKLK